MIFLQQKSESKVHQKSVFPHCPARTRPRYEYTDVPESVVPDSTRALAARVLIYCQDRLKVGGVTIQWMRSAAVGEKHDFDFIELVIGYYLNTSKRIHVRYDMRPQEIVRAVAMGVHSVWSQVVGVFGQDAGIRSRRANVFADSVVVHFKEN